MALSKHIDDQIKVVFFDHDDTLVGTIEPKWAEHKHIARLYYGKKLVDTEITEHWGKPLNELVCLLYGTDDVDQAIAYNTAHHLEYPKLLFPSTIPVLQQIHAAGKLIGIITATSRFSFEHDLTLHKVPREILDYTQTAEDTPYHKPDPRVFEPALRWINKRQIAPEEVLYIGDGLHDMKAALGAGFSFLGVTSGLVTAHEFTKQNAKSISGIDDLIQE